MRWDESNCSFDENEFVRKAYAEKKTNQFYPQYLTHKKNKPIPKI